jgi:hypothetical protein
MYWLKKIINNAKYAYNSLLHGVWHILIKFNDGKITDIQSLL